MRYLAIFAISITLSFGAANPPIQDRTGTGLVLSSHELANKIGKEVLDKGGNAIDAAVAVGYALAVVHPAAGNIGGGGFAVIHLANGENTTLDFREMAPLKASRNMYLDSKGEVIKDASTIGYLAAGVPGTVKGMSAMLDRYGTMKLKDLMAPAIKLAEKGYLINDRQEQTMLEAKDMFKEFPSSSKYFLKKDGSTYKSGDLFVQKDLAKTLKLIAKEGPDAFYKGKIADLIAADMAKQGIITKEDLAQYQAIWRKPVEGTYRGYDIISMSPPSSGGAHIIEILNIMENANIENLGFASSKTLHIMAEAMRQAYADRSEYMGDPDFVKIPLDKLTSKEYAKEIYAKIPKDKALPSSKVKPGLGQIHEGHNTTHYSVLDSKGNAVSITYTINASYGSGAAVEGAGFLLNDEMDDFSIKPGVPNLYGLVGGEANAIEPKKRPLSSMSPTIILKDGKVFMVVGSPGGSRIITTVLQVISNVIDHKMDISTAVESPRFHMQWLPDEIRTEPFGIIKDVQNNLEKMGYKITKEPYMGDVNAIMVDPKTGKIVGSMDTRKEF
ncbi:gamma-glutamyltransferase [Campylobacter jejuni subsp. jejuni HN-CJD07035]|uniref:gamma-glutamyltransferase n=1 Tax=Campylobacter jejuni TaxID=197 RepID=UPI000068A167|nr:gamma-glutamyltransferase [Campylobacter jejuni]ALF91113.1 gamma-glutamyltranspeptidase [Campylobacter jejuni subsp. jejuni]ALF92745.1 gamma-glutamyltranspeptidase [Campylobacter jejuni subsp. jejuni]EAJ7464278.1 gamma-glutamyltransferase [Campylobacter jejuni]EAK1060899.1 gamma-glutamyltransferase [Campylobacter jejuni]EAK1066005.1 gamma-glutamyltransferase [Campylobacter jejuni]